MAKIVSPYKQCDKFPVLLEVHLLCSGCVQIMSMGDKDMIRFGNAQTLVRSLTLCSFMALMRARICSRISLWKTKCRSEC